MDATAKEVIDQTYAEIRCGGRTLKPSQEIEITLAAAGYAVTKNETTYVYVAHMQGPVSPVFAGAWSTIEAAEKWAAGRPDIVISQVARVRE